MSSADFDIVLATELPGWTLVYSPGGPICLQDSKLIILGSYEPDSMAMLLHEIAHGKVGPGHGHDGIWGDEFTRLVNKYMIRKPSPAYSAEGLLEILESLVDTPELAS